MKKYVLFLPLLLTISAGPAGTQVSENTGPVQACSNAFAAPPNTGTAFRGAVRNDDYHFVAHIPAGLTAWTGTAESAPFHGFAISLDKDFESCIVFEVHIRIDEADAMKRPQKAKTISLGRAEGGQTRNALGAGANRLVNITTVFSFKQSDQIDDGYVLLIVPVKQLPDASNQYHAFLRGLKFGI